jgi:hypothetical protein
MLRNLFILIFLQITAVGIYGQDSVRFSGQFSSWANVNGDNDLPLWGGARYIPQFNYAMPLEKKGQYDTEVSANIFGSAGLHPFDTLTANGKIKPYRAWFRYSSHQLELRVGLQKINFGSAAMIRPLMWFDQMDPRDPLQLTDGVWGLLARYYFLNNANIWLWGLYGNNERRGWEVIPVNRRIPEFGGRLQLPVTSGEIAFSFNHRVADSRGMEDNITPIEKIPENKFGFDAKWDLTTGLWLEGSYAKKSRDVGIYTNQLVLNAGLDYTFDAGNGIYMAMEQLLVAYDERPFAFSDKAFFSLMTIRYPVGLFDNLSTILFYNWGTGDIYSFLNWQRQYDKIILYIMAFWNPERFDLPSQSGSHTLMAGKGIQVMFVFNH